MNEEGMLTCDYCKKGILNINNSVKCPNCNLYYHNECWEKNKGCTCDNSKIEDEEILISELVTCPECKSSLEKEQKFCNNCGYDFKLGKSASRKNSNSKRRIFSGIIVIGLIIVLALTLINKKPNFNKMFPEYSTKKWCNITEDGTFMEIDTNYLDLDDYYDKDAYDAIKDINKKLEFSESVIKKMGNTRSLDGRQSDETKKYIVSWTYHPNNGLEVYYEIKK